MKKFGLIAVCSIALAFAGCGKSDDAGTAGRSITIWWAQWAPADGLQELGNRFEKETGIAVNVHQIPWSAFQDQVFLDFGHRRTSFDIIIGDSQWMGYGAERGLYVDLTDWLPTVVDIDAIHPQAVRYLCEYPPGSGRLFAAPCETDAVGFAYRKDWFEDPAEKAAFVERYGRELAVPETWDEFCDVAEFFTRPDKRRYGCAVLTGRDYDSLTMGFQQMMWMFGGSWGNPQTYKTQGYVNSAQSAAALAFYKSLLQYAPPGGANFSYDGTLEAFTNGSTAMTMIFFAFFPGIVEEMGGKADFFVMPSRGGLRAVSLGGQGMSISAKTPPEQQELAKKFIAWFLQANVQKEWITKPAGFTAHVEILKSEAFHNASPYNKQFAESLDHIRDFWTVPQYAELLATAQRYVGEALDGVKTPEEALDTIAGEHERIFREAGLLKGD